jgi:hypothetical protein
VQCCTIPPIVEGKYTPKGTYKPYGGFEKVCATGPEDSDSALVFIQDIFGWVGMFSRVQPALKNLIGTILKLCKERTCELLNLRRGVISDQILMMWILHSG